MSHTSLGVSAPLQHYLNSINPSEPALLCRLREETARLRQGKMHIAPAQAQLLAWLAQLLAVKNYLEIGVFTGYSSTALALALPGDARITACDISVTYTDIARRYWTEAQVAHKIELSLQPAIITLDELIAQGKCNHYDLALIDADKAATPHYFERCLKLIRPNGVIAIDNVLSNGRVFQAACETQSQSIQILRRFNQSLKEDTRVSAVTLPIGDGLTLVQKCTDTVLCLHSIANS
ncbi:class I SAM-dependent methyltransferase [Stenoxybacter acetivorans]|uniref:class I SAM-dependent methyltransferase n=1 Tax=Stenoxybacter acetivorans TaxID=422441 RepID=UPI00068B98A7|nr:class I SAM-dependent methyltransferase [Stenoxybacter acetivorans]